MLVSAGVWIALDRRIGRNRHGPGIAFISISSEVDGDGRLRRIHGHVRDPHVTAVILSRTKVGMHRCTGPNEVDDRSRIRVHRSRRNILIPWTASRERQEAVQAGALESGYFV